MAARIQVSLRFADGSEAREDVRVPDPSNDVDLLYRVVQRRFESLAAKSPVVGMTLALQPASPKKRQFDFFRETLKDPNRFAQTLAELEALLGSERVGRPRPRDSHRPDAFDLEPFDRSVETVSPPPASEDVGLSEDPDQGTVSLGLPLRRCRPPVRVRVEVERRDGVATPVRVLDGSCRGWIAAAQGPWKTSGEWWEARPWVREEWDIELGEGKLCQLVRRDQEWFWRDSTVE